MRLRITIAALLSLLLTMSAALAESPKGHSLVSGKAVEALALLPPSAGAANLAAFYARYRPYLEQHASDLNAIRAFDAQERPKHFFDMDGYEPRLTFKDIPHARAAAGVKYGLDKMNVNGTLPWEIGDDYKLLVNAFRARDLPGILYQSATLGALVGELHQPFHVTSNYNGFKTRQYGIHDRFETQLIAGDLDPRTVVPAAPAQILNMMDAPFDWAAQSYTQVAPILAADQAAAAQDAAHGPAYRAAFTKAALPIARSQFALAATDLASLYYTAWVQAGRPPLPADINPVQAPVQAR